MEVLYVPLPADGPAHDVISGLGALDGDKNAVVVRGLEPNEPVFVLRARDRLAGSAVDYWLNMAAPLLADARLEQAQASWRAMLEWQARNPGLVRNPD